MATSTKDHHHQRVGSDAAAAAAVAAGVGERKFTRGLSKPGSAAAVRETVSLAVRKVNLT